uniref:NHL repeat containing protein n=1 Tax=Geobacter sp. (strain M21) TaxID=443144 RepID=C6E3J4_GEOSM
MAVSVFRWLSRHKPMRGVVAALALPLCLLCASCATLEPTQPIADRQELQWPPLPLMPRIQWVKEIRDPHGAGIEKGMWRRFTEVFTGAVENRIGKPYGVYFDERGSLFVVDVSYGVVHVMDTREKSYYIIGDAEKRTFRSPIGITEDDRDNLYITDSGAAGIFRYNLTKKKLEPFIISDLARPTGIVFNKSNRLLYITDTTEHQVVVFDLKGNLRYRIGSRGSAAGHFNYPTDINVDNSGRLYVTDALNSRISIFSAEGTHLNSFGRSGDTAGNLPKAKGVAVDSAGNIYIVDALLDAVQIFDQSGVLLLTFGSNGTNAGEFWMPSGIYIDRNDYIYVSDSYNRRIQVFKYLDVKDASARAVEPARNKQTEQ